MNIMFSQNALEDLDFLQVNLRKDAQRVVKLLKDISRTPFDGIGKPEPLKGELSGYWSRRVNDKDRLIYKVENSTVFVLTLRTHYFEK